jgi:hypothetical protein
LGQRNAYPSSLPIETFEAGNDFGKIGNEDYTKGNKRRPHGNRKRRSEAAFLGRLVAGYLIL